MSVIIITNNPQVNIEYMDQYEVLFLKDVKQIDILYEARDRIHTGARLIMTPMPGKIKPHETPYKSVLLYIDHANKGTDLESVMIIEESINMTQSSLCGAPYLKYDKNHLDDLQLIDKDLLKNGINEMRNSHG